MNFPALEMTEESVREEFGSRGTNSKGHEWGLKWSAQERVLADLGFADHLAAEFAGNKLPEKLETAALEESEAIALPR